MPKAHHDGAGNRSLRLALKDTMDLDQERTHLEVVNRHIECGERRLSRQRELVEQARSSGSTGEDEVRFLAAMENALQALQDLRVLILETIARLEAKGA